MTTSANWVPMSGSYLNGWSDYGAPNTVGAYLKDFTGLVHLRGTIKNGTMGLPCFTLPSGSRPNSIINFPANANAAFGYIQIRTDGTVVPMLGSNTLVDLNGIYFDAGDTTFYAATATAHKASTQAIPANTWTIVNYEVVDTDTNAGITIGSAWSYKCPSDGTYRVQGAVGFQVATANTDSIISVYKNGSEVQRGFRTQMPSTLQVNLPYSIDVPCLTGDLLNVQVYFVTNAQTLSSNITDNRISITKVVGIAAPYLGYSTPMLLTQGANQSILNNTLTILLLTTVVRDTDAAYNTGSGQWTCPAGKGGDYEIGCSCAYLNAITGTPFIGIYKNGTFQFGAQLNAPGAGVTMSTKVTLTLAPSDIIDVRTQHTAGSTQALSNQPGFNFLSIKRISDGLSSAPTMCKARYYRNSAQAIPQVTFTVVNFDQKDYDSDNAVVTGVSWKFTVPPGKGGVYRISSSVGIAGSGNAAGGEVVLSLQKNGGEITRNRLPGWPAGAAIVPSVSSSISCQPGDYLQVFIYQNPNGGTASQNTSNIAQECNVCIEGPVDAAPAAISNPIVNDVAAIYHANTTQSISNSTWTPINFDSREIDTDNAVTTGASWAFVCPANKGGRYLFSATAQFNPSAAGGLVAIDCYDVIASERRGGGVTNLFNSTAFGGLYVTVTSEIILNPGDKVQFRIWQNSGAALSTVVSNPACTHCYIQRIPDTVIPAITGGDSAWSAPSFQNGWVNSGGSTFSVGYFKDSSGFVHLRGNAKSGTVGAPMFTLPVGYRSTAVAYYPTLDGVNALSYVRVASDGTVMMGIGNNGQCLLDGITFDTRP